MAHRFRRLIGIAPALRNDPLTRIATAAALNAALEREARRLARAGGCVGVVIADLESFKAINDAFGHAAGDTVLSEVASRLEAVAGADGLVARLGGDEFAVLAPGVATPTELAALAEEMRVAVSREPISLGSQQCTVAATVGAALMDRSVTPHLVVRRADEQMYLAKRVSGTDPFDRVSELIVGLLEAGDGGLEDAVTSGVAEVARAHAAFVESAEGESWWPGRPGAEAAEAFRQFAAEARAYDAIVEEVEIGKWRLAAPLRGDGRPIGAFAADGISCRHLKRERTSRRRSVRHEPSRRSMQTQARKLLAFHVEGG